MYYRVLDRLLLTDQETVESEAFEIVSNELGGECASTVTLGLVVSIGCTPAYSSRYQDCQKLSFPLFTDETATILLFLWEKLVPVIVYYTEYLQQTVVIHCVYGQSRSVATIIACLIRSQRNPMSLTDALHHVKRVKPTVSINPGFLSQLVLWNALIEQSPAALQIFRIFSIEMERVFGVNTNKQLSLLAEGTRNWDMVGFRSVSKALATETCAEKRQRTTYETSPMQLAPQIILEDVLNEKPIVKENESVCEDSENSEEIGQVELVMHRTGHCRNCNRVLVQDEDFIESSIDCQPMVSEHTDAFWTNFGVCKEAKQNVIPIDGYVAVVPNADLVVDDKGINHKQEKKQDRKGSHGREKGLQKGDDVMRCRHCKHIVGVRRRHGNYFGPFTTASLFLLSRAHLDIRLKPQHVVNDGCSSLLIMMPTPTTKEI